MSPSITPSLPRRSRALAGGVLVVASLTVLAGCASPGAVSAEGGTLVYATGDAEPTCLDPHVGGNYPQALLSSQVLESLVSRDSAGEIIPWLASAWEVSGDGLTWEFTLPEGKLSLIHI